MKKYILPLMLTGVAAVPAAAQAQETSPFTGPRAEVLVGYDSLRSGSDVDDDTTNDSLFDNNGPDESIDGFAYGFGLGYDFDLGPAVIGVEGEFMDSTGKENADEFVNAPFGYRVNVSRDLYVGARAGYQVAPKTLLYVKGGYTNTRVRARFQDRDPGDNADFNFDTGQTIDGYRVGAGVEQLIGGPVLGIGSSGYVKLEYRYSKYSNLSFGDKIFADNFANDDIDIDLDRHQVIAGVGFRF